MKILKINSQYLILLIAIMLSLLIHWLSLYFIAKVAYNTNNSTKSLSTKNESIDFNLSDEKKERNNSNILKDAKLNELLSKNKKADNHSPINIPKKKEYKINQIAEKTRKTNLRSDNIRIKDENTSSFILCIANKEEIIKLLNYGFDLVVVYKEKTYHISPSSQNPSTLQPYELNNDNDIFTFEIHTELAKQVIPFLKEDFLIRLIPNNLILNQIFALYNSNNKEIRIRPIYEKDRLSFIIVDKCNYNMSKI